MKNLSAESKLNTDKNYWQELEFLYFSKETDFIAKNLIANWQKFFTLLAQKNQHLNLTRIESEKEAILKHFLDSWHCLLALKSYVQINKHSSLLDFGCGGGFPSFPIILGSNYNFNTYLVDARLKKLSFLEEAAKALNLKVNTIHENWNSKTSKAWAKKNGLIDFVMARAVAKSDDLLNILAPISKKALLLTRGPNLLDNEFLNCQKLAFNLGFQKAYLIEKEISFLDLNISRKLFLFLKK